MQRGFALLLLGLAASPLQAEAAKRIGAPDSPISASVELPAGSHLIYVSGQVPDVINPAAPEGSVDQFGDTEAQTRSVIRKIEGVLFKGKRTADEARRKAKQMRKAGIR